MIVMKERKIRKPKLRIQYGGRGLINVIENLLLDPLAWYLFRFRRQLKEGALIRAHLSENQIKFTIGNE